MRIHGKLVGLIIAGCLLSLTPLPSWGQDAIGEVLAIEKEASINNNCVNGVPQGAFLKFRDPILKSDRVCTGTDAKVKILLKDKSVMTLAEKSEMTFDEFLLEKDQSSVTLRQGTLRVLTSLFSRDSKKEVRTPNTIAGVRGTIFVVKFTPPDQTEIFTLDGEVATWNPNIPKIDEVIIGTNFRSSITGVTAPPARAREIAPAERQQLDRALQVTAQIPSATTTTKTQQAAAQQTTTARGDTATRTGTSGTSAGGGAGAAAPGIDLPALEPPDSGLSDRGALEAITADSSPAGRDVIERALVNIIINFPSR